MAYLHVSPDVESTAVEAAEFIMALSAWDIHHRGRFTIALSGGSTPKLLYQVLAAPPYLDRIEWDKWEVFWSDERYVPPDDPDSNYRMVVQALLDFVPILHSNVHPVEVDLKPREAADSYQATIRRVFKQDTPSFDLVLLDVGADGHTASLFPGTEAVKADERFVATNRASASDSDRITFRLPIINAARSVAFLLVGQDKAEVARRVFDGGGDHTRLPVALVQPESDEPHVFLDSTAASLLAKREDLELSAES